MNIGGIIGIVCGGGSALIAVVVVGFFMLRMFLGQQQRQNLLQTGIPAQALIVSVQETGLRINEEPQARVTVQVTPTDRPPFQAVITQVFSIFEVGMVTPGATIQVRFDPNDPSKVAIESLGGNMMPGMAPNMMPQGMVAPGMAGGTNNPQLQDAMLAQDQFFEQLRQTGIEATATIIGSTNMNIRNDNKSWVFDLTFDVAAPSGEHFQSKTQAAIVDASLYKYQVGKQVIVRFNPTNRTQCALVRALEA